MEGRLARDDAGGDSKGLIPTRASLLRRLVNLGDHVSWCAFYDTYWKLIYRTAERSGLTHDEAQDVVQETMISVAHHIAEFRYSPEKGSFKGWLLSLTHWRILDQLRKRHRRRHETTLESDSSEEDPHRDLPFANAELEALWDAEWKCAMLRAAVERVKRKVNLRHFQIFELLTLQNWTVSRVAKTLRVKQGHVYLARFLVHRKLKKEIEELERQPFSLGGGPVSSKTQCEFAESSIASLLRIAWTIAGSTGMTSSVK